MSTLYCIIAGCKREATYIFKGYSLCAEHAEPEFKTAMEGK